MGNKNTNIGNKLLSDILDAKKQFLSVFMLAGKYRGENVYKILANWVNFINANFLVPIS